MRRLPRRIFLVALLIATLSGLRAAAGDAPPSADQVLAEAKAEAASQHKGIFLIFGASWCGWCRKLDQFNHVPEVSAILDKSYVIVHLTVEEHKDKAQLNNPGAEDLMKRLGGQGGLPYFAFLDQDGKPIVTSNRPPDGQKGDLNIGFPGTSQEVAWFLAMMSKALPSLSSDQLRILKDQIHRQLP